LQTLVLLPQACLTFDPKRINRNAVHRTKLHTLRFVKVADAFSAFGRVNFVNLLPHVNRVIRAFGLTDIAVDAFIGDEQGHGLN
jgi:hypothetical protein